MILHLVLDEKVIPRMMDLFDENYSENIYICITRKRKFENLRYLRNRDNLFLLYGGQLNTIPWKRIKRVCIHFLCLHTILAFHFFTWFKKLRPKSTLWFAWGGDYYDIIEKMGFKIYSENNSQKKIHYKTLRESFFWHTYDYLEDLLKINFIKHHINYIVASKIEFDLIQRSVPLKHLKGRLDFTYYSIEDVLKGLTDPEINGNNIIIGNSASSSNNHEYIYDIVKNLCYKDEKILIPMSYGIDSEYLNIVSSLFSNLANARIITDFLDIESYNKLLCGCSTFIYGHFRQEGWGNIIIALYLEGKVYLPRNSQNYKNFVDFGFKVFDLESIKSTFQEKLSDSEKVHNRNLALSLFSKEKTKHYIQNICNAE